MRKSTILLYSVPQVLCWHTRVISEKRGTSSPRWEKPQQRCLTSGWTSHTSTWSRSSTSVLCRWWIDKPPLRFSLDMEVCVVDSQSVLLWFFSMRTAWRSSTNIRTQRCCCIWPERSSNVANYKSVNRRFWGWGNQNATCFFHYINIVLFFINKT